MNILIKELYKNCLSKCKNDKKEVTRLFTNALRKNEQLLNFVTNYKTGKTLIEKAYCIIHNLNEVPLCIVCKSKHQRFQKLYIGYQNTCSSKCSNIQKYGVDNPAKAKSVIEKTRKTMIKKYGGYGASSKILLEKRNKTIQEKYGCNYQETNDYKNKCKATNLEKYGSEFYTLSNDYFEKIEKTKLEKYNGLHWNQTNDAKEVYRNIFYNENRSEKTGLGQRNSFYDKLKVELDKKFELLFSKEEYKAHRNLDLNKPNYYKFKCLKCGFIFEESLINYRRDGIYCRSCESHSRSHAQHVFFQYISQKYNNLYFMQDIVGKLSNKRELDIFSEENNVGIEYNGLIWHAEKYNGFYQNKHFEKFQDCLNHNIDLIAFWSDEIDHNFQICEKMLDVIFLKNEHFSVNINNIKIENCLNKEYFNNSLIKNISNEKLIKVVHNDIEFILKYHENVLYDIVPLTSKQNKKIIQYILKNLNINTFDLENRFYAFYNKILNLKIESFNEAKFYQFNNGIRSFNLNNDINLKCIDKIWNYGYITGKLF